jgi:phospholipase/carboxylesterase
VAVGFSNGANVASALMLQHPRLLRGALLVAAMVPYAAAPPAADLTGVDVLVSNGARDPMIPASMTAELEGQLRDRGATVTDLGHRGGHQLDPVSVRRAAPLVAAMGQQRD